MKFLVTGGLGFIGSNMVDFLIDKGHSVVIVDDVSTGSKDYINRSQNAYYYMYPDGLNHQGQMYDLMEGVDGVFHFAAWARLMRSIDDPIGTNHANVDGTVNILQAARRRNVKKVVFSSSSSVYGYQKFAQMHEKLLPEPLHPYALQKWVGEKYCKLFSRLFGIQTVALRYFNVYGNRQITKGDYALVIGKFLEAKKEGKPMTIYGDGEQTRAYTHVTDIVKANWLAFEKEVNGGQFDVFNIGTDVETSVNQIAKLIGGKVEHIMPNPRGDFEERRKCADFGKANRILGWEPQVTIEEGIKMLCQ